MFVEFMCSLYSINYVCCDEAFFYLTAGGTAASDKLSTLHCPAETLTHKCNFNVVRGNGFLCLSAINYF